MQPGTSKKQTEIKPICLMSWDINGIKKEIKEEPRKQKILEVIFKIAKKNNVSIIFLQETHIGPNDTHVFENMEKWKHFFTTYNPRRRGVAIFIRKDIGFELLETNLDHDGGYIVVKCKLQGQLYTLVSVYSVWTDKLVLARLIRYLKRNPDGLLVIGGDFNTALDRVLDRKTRALNLDNAAMRGYVQEMTTHLNLVDVWREIHPEEKRYTCYQRDSRARIDYIFMKKETMCRVKTCEILDDTPKVYSDHKPVWLQLKSDTDDADGSQDDDDDDDDDNDDDGDSDCGDDDDDVDE